MIPEKAFFYISLLLPLVARALSADHFFSHHHFTLPEVLLLTDSMLGPYVMFVVLSWVYFWRKGAAQMLSFIMYAPVLFCFLLFSIHDASDVGTDMFYRRWDSAEGRVLDWLKHSGVVVAGGYAYVGLAMLLRHAFRTLRVVKA